MKTNAVSGSVLVGIQHKIIYSHVPDADRLGKASMDELLDFKVAEIERAREELRKDIGKVNAEILDAERKLTEEYRGSLSAQLAAKNAELAALDGAKPSEIADPNASQQALAESKEAAARLSASEALVQALAAEEAAMRERKATLARKHAVAQRISQSLANHKKHHETFLSELAGLLPQLGDGIEAGALVAMRIDAGPVDKISTAAVREIASIEAALADEAEGSLAQRKSDAASAVDAAKGELDEPQRLFVRWKDELAAWATARAAIVGEVGKQGTIAQLTDDIAALDHLPAALAGLRARRADLARAVHARIRAMVDEYQRLYLPVQDFVDSDEQKEMNLPLDFQVRIEESGFAQELLGMLNQRVRGSFMGVDDSALLLRGMLQEAGFATAEDALAFADRIDDMLKVDRREGQSAREVRLRDQLARGASERDILDYLYAFDYLSPRYSLTYAGQEIGQLSPGERGLLLLVFYLLVDEDDVPIVIDRPEENLDNQTIFTVLVRCIKRAKERRQVIMVTHNPNLAVVCDAEQIIFASCDKAESRFDYSSGAIENPDIKAKVVQILEGTEPAFKNRQSKYRIA